MARQFIYHMQGLSKTWPGGKKVLENVHTFRQTNFVCHMFCFGLLLSS
jgi:hypothetical protein